MPMEQYGKGMYSKAEKPKRGNGRPDIARSIVLGIGMPEADERESRESDESGLDEALHAVFDPGVGFDDRKKAFRLAVEMLQQHESKESAEED